MKRLLICFLLLASVSWAGNATTPADLSAGDVAEWAITGGHIGSGSGALPAVASIGVRYTDISTPSAPVDYRSDGSFWRVISGSGGTGGTSDHAALSNLSYAASGHTGFQSVASMSFYQLSASMSDYLLANTAASQYVGSSAFSTEHDARVASEGAIRALVPGNGSFTLSGLSEKSFSSLTGQPTAASYTLAGLSNKDFSSLANKPTTLSGYGVTDAAGINGSSTIPFSCATPTLGVHAANMAYVLANAAAETATFTGNKAIVGNASISGTLTQVGTATFINRVIIPYGTAARPGLSFAGNPGDGIYQNANTAGRFDIVCAGANVFYIVSGICNASQFEAGVIYAEGYFRGNAAAGPKINSNSAASSTSAIYGFLDEGAATGIGRYAVTKPSMVTNNIENQRWEPTGTTLFLPATFTGNIYCASDVSALSFTDRSDAPESLESAYAIVDSHESIGGKVDHSKLDPAAWGHKTRMETTGRTIMQSVQKEIPLEEQEACEPGKEPVTMKAEAVEVPEMRAVEEPDQSKRSVSMCLSAAMMTIKDLQRRIEKLESR